MAEAPQGWTSWRPSLVERGQRELTIPVRHDNPSGSDSLPKEQDVRDLASQPSADLSKLFEDMKLKAPDPLYDNDSDDDIGRRWVSYSKNQYDSDQDEAKDFAACDSECGYCGRCPY